MPPRGRPPEAPLLFGPGGIESLSPLAIRISTLGSTVTNATSRSTLFFALDADVLEFHVTLGTTVTNVTLSSVVFFALDADETELEAPASYAGASIDASTDLFRARRNDETTGPLGTLSVEPASDVARAAAGPGMGAAAAAAAAAPCIRSCKQISFGAATIPPSHRRQV